MSAAARELQVTPLSMVRTRRQKWAVEDLVPLSVATILAGRGGIGKSTILAWLAAGITRGTFPGDMHNHPAAVGFISGEDDPATTLKPRLEAAGADVDGIFDLSGVKTTAEDGTSWTGLPSISSDMAALRAALVEHGIKVLVIDPVISIMDGDTIKATDVRRNLDPIAGLAADLEIAVVLVMHFGKGQGNASDKVSGSHAFRDIARSVLLLAVDEDSDQRILTVDKSNYSQAAPSFAFSIESVRVPTDEGDDAIVGRAKPLGPTQLTVHELVRRASDDNLGDLSASILGLINAHPDVVDVSMVVAELGVSADRARTYLTRLVDSKRITRVSRGRYSRNNTADIAESSVTTVSSVSSDPPYDTNNTLHTLSTGVEQLFRSPATQQQGTERRGLPPRDCRVCGTPLHPAVASQGVHPHCASEHSSRLTGPTEPTRGAA